VLKRATIVSLSLLALLAACNKKEAGAPQQSSAPPPMPSEYDAPAAEPAAAGAKVAQDSDRGKKVFDTTCMVCHGTGVAGAPKFGDKTSWAPRIAQGKETLYMHALNGFTGKSGVMPPRGGNTTLTDSDVKAAVDHMVAHGK